MLYNVCDVMVCFILYAFHPHSFPSKLSWNSQHLDLKSPQTSKYALNKINSPHLSSLWFFWFFIACKKDYLRCSPQEFLADLSYKILQFLGLTSEYTIHWSRVEGTSDPQCHRGLITLKCLPLFQHCTRIKDTNGRVTLYWLNDTNSVPVVFTL